MFEKKVKFGRRQIILYCLVICTDHYQNTNINSWYLLGLRRFVTIDNCLSAR